MVVQYNKVLFYVLTEEKRLLEWKRHDPSAQLRRARVLRKPSPCHSFWGRGGGQGAAYSRLKYSTQSMHAGGTLTWEALAPPVPASPLLPPATAALSLVSSTKSVRRASGTARAAGDVGTVTRTTRPWLVSSPGVGVLG